MAEFSRLSGGVTFPSGFKAAGTHCGIKAGNDDLALLVSDVPAAVAAMFTTNAVQAAPVAVSKESLKSGCFSAVVVNSGCANACTGESGYASAMAMRESAADALGVASENVFVCSTGTIGKPLPLEKITGALPDLAQALSADGGAAAARAIMTTDTVPKECALTLEIGGKEVRVGGMAKGVGMIEPKLATMLAFITTDAEVEPKSLQSCLAAAVNRSFNRVTVDGDQSTNDTVLLVANGCADAGCLDEQHPEWHKFCEAVGVVALDLAQQMVRDGEGATKFVTITVKGAMTPDDANLAAKAVANSMLCKTAWFGGDPNWGRIIAAVGYSGARVNPGMINIAFDGVEAVVDGCMAPGVSFEALESVFAATSFEIEVDLKLGQYEDTVYTCDCSYEYVKINAEYMT